MKLLKSIVLTMLILLLFAPALSLAESGYETGDGWVYQDGTLTITTSDGLVNYIYHDEALIYDPPDQQSPFDVDQVVIGKNVKEDIVIEYFIAKSILSKTTIEEGNSCYVIENGWIINTATKTLFGAADVANKKELSIIDDLPNNIEHIGMFAFDDYRNLEQIELPNSIVSIRESSFNGCDRLEGISLPSNTTSIGIAAFSGCSKLVHVNLDAAITSIEVAAFDACGNLETPSIFKTSIEVVHGNCFWGCNQFRIVEFPSTARKVENQAFAKCDILNTLIFNSDQLIVEDGAFSYCENVRKLIFIKGKPTAIGSVLFGEDGRTPDGKSFIQNMFDADGEILPYPTLYYTAAYADEWAPNGETEWNGYTIQQISQGDLDAILAEARGEELPVATASPVPTAAQQIKTTIAGGAKAETAPATGIETILLIAIGTVAVAVAVVLIIRNQKTKR